MGYSEEEENKAAYLQILQLLEREVNMHEEYKDVIAAYNEKHRREISVDVYFGEAYYTVYEYDGSKFMIWRDNEYEENVSPDLFPEAKNRCICGLLRKYYQLLQPSFES